MQNWSPHENPAGNDSEIVIAVVVGNPFSAVIEGDVETRPPLTVLTDAGLTVMEKSGGGAAVTITVNVAWCESVPDVPVKTIEYVAAATDEAASSCADSDCP